jgi:hypothetical protein
VKLRLWNVKYAIDDDEQDEVLIVEAGTAGMAYALALAFIRRRLRADGVKVPAWITGIADGGTVDARAR